MVKKSARRKQSGKAKKERKPRKRGDAGSVSPNEAAKMLAVTGEAVKQWIYKGDLKATKLENGYWRIQHEDLAQYLNTRQSVTKFIHTAVGDAGVAGRVASVAEALGCRAEPVGDVSDALAKFRESAPVLVVVDLQSYPQAWNLIRRVRGTSRFGSPKILLLASEQLSEIDGRQAARFGLQGCLFHPVGEDVLTTEVKRLIS